MGGRDGKIPIIEKFRFQLFQNIYTYIIPIPIIQNTDSDYFPKIPTNTDYDSDFSLIPLTIISKTGKTSLQCHEIRQKNNHF